MEEMDDEEEEVKDIRPGSKQHKLIKRKKEK